MRTKKSGQEPAFASNILGIYQPGMSKRFYAACAAMQGLLSNSKINELVSNDIHKQRVQIAVSAFDFADELLKQEVE